MQKSQLADRITIHDTKHELNTVWRCPSCGRINLAKSRKCSCGVNTKRQRLDIPAINSVIGWICNHSVQNLWRIGQWYELEDLINDGLLIALKCRNKLGDQVDTAQFVAYVKTAFQHHITDLVREKLGVQEYRFLDKYSEDVSIDTIMEPDFPEQELIAALSNPPENIKRVLSLFFSEQGRAKLRQPLRQRIDGSETEEQRLKRLADWPLELNFYDELKEYLFVG